MADEVLEQGQQGGEAEKIVLPSDEKKAGVEGGGQAEINTQPQPKQETPQDNSQDDEKPAGVDVASFEKEYSENGKLSDKSYEALAKVGISREVVDRYIEGRIAYAASYDEQVFSIAGGKDDYKSMTEWAAANLSQQEIDSYNKAVQSRDIELAKLATAGLVSRYKTSQTPTAKSIEGGAGVNSGSYYSSMAELVSDQKDERYNKDPRYRQAVNEKLNRSLASGNFQR